MTLLAQCMQLLWSSLENATSYFGRIIMACGMPFGLFLTLITSLFVINILFVAYRYRTIGEVMGDRAEKFSSSEAELSSHDRAANAYYKSQTNAVIYNKASFKAKYNASGQYHDRQGRRIF